MPEVSYFPRTISGETDLHVDDLIVDDLIIDGVATIPNLVVPAPTFATLTLTSTSGTSFTVNSTTQGSAILDNSAVFKGGVGIVKGLTIGQILKVNDTTVSTSKTTGAVQVAGGVGVVGRVSANSFGLGTSALISSNDNDVFINANVESIYLRPTQGTNTGALVNSVGDLFVRSTTNATIFLINKTTNTITLAKLIVTDTIVATSKTTGSATFAGGIGVAGKMYSDTVHTVGDIEIGGFELRLGTADASRGTAGGHIALAMIGTSQLYINYGNDFYNGVKVDSALSVTGITTLPNTTASTSTTTGAVQVVGGLGIVGNLSGSTAKFYNTTDSMSATTGSVTFAGGIGVQQRIHATSYGLKNTTITSTDNDFYITASTSNIYLKAIPSTTNSEFSTGPVDLYVRNTVGTVILLVDKTSNLTTLNTLSVTNGTTILGSSGTTLQVNSTTDATSAAVGSIRTLGGIAAAKKIYSSESITAYTGMYVRNGSWTTNGDDIYLNGLNGIFLRTTAGAAYEMANSQSDFYVRDSNAASTIFRIDKSTSICSMVRLTVSNTTASTSVGTGAVILQGGLAINKNTNATSATNGGSLTSAGGFGFAQDGYIGGNTYVTGSLSCSSITFTNTSGTFIPTIQSDTTVTYTNQVGNWYTIGKMVFITLRVRTTSVLYLASGQALSVAGLPFTSGLVESQIGPGPLFTGYALPTSTDYVVSRIISGASNVTFYAVKDNLDDSFVEAPITAASRTIRLSMVYQIT